MVVLNGQAIVDVSTLIFIWLFWMSFLLKY